MIIAGIESSCDESAVAILDIQGDKVVVLSNVISSQVNLHTEYGGVVPAIAAREHVKNLPIVCDQAIEEAGKPNIEAIAVTAGPGLISSLLVGMTFAQTKAYLLNIPLVPVNHIEGHILSALLNKQNSEKDFLFRLPASVYRLSSICLTVSGGHTQITLVEDIGKYKLIGETLDDAAGECFDKVARLLELGYPGGPAISKKALEYNPTTNPITLSLPRPMQHSGDFNFSFSGLKTAVLYAIRDIKDKYNWHDIQTKIAHEAQEAITDVLVQKTIKAAQKYNTTTILLAGGVSANSVLREKMTKEAKNNGFEILIPDLKYTTDNAAMIALAGYFKYTQTENKSEFNWQDIQVDANSRVC